MSRQRQRFDAVDVEAGTRDRLRSQRAHERGFVDDRAARDVDQQRARLHAGEFAFSDQVTRFGREHGVDRNDVGPCEQLAEVVVLVDSGTVHRVAVDVRVVADDAHAKTATGDPRDAGSDPADADEPERLAP